MKVRKQDASFNESIKERDNYKCRVCHRTPTTLHLHHLLPYKKYPEYRFEEKNVVSLCPDCHSEFHSMYGKKVISEREFEEYKEYKWKIVPVIQIMLNSWKKFDANAIEFYNITFPKVWANYRDAEKNYTLQELWHSQYYQITIEAVLKCVNGRFRTEDDIPNFELLSNFVADECIINFAREGWEVNFNY